MRSRVLAGSLLVLAMFTAGGAASTGAHMVPKQWAIVNFADPVTLQGHVLMGPYLIVHDDEQMAKGEPCTSIYRFDRARGPQELEATFVCQPAQRSVCDKTTFATAFDPALGLNRVVEYQFAGDSEAHGVPAR